MAKQNLKLVTLFIGLSLVAGGCKKSGGDKAPTPTPDSGSGVDPAQPTADAPTLSTIFSGQLALSMTDGGVAQNVIDAVTSAGSASVAAKSALADASVAADGSSFVQGAEAALNNADLALDAKTKKLILAAIAKACSHAMVEVAAQIDANLTGAALTDALDAIG